MRQDAPTVIVAVSHSPAALDRCLASLQRTLPAGTAVLVADDASGDPQVAALARAWCASSGLAARHVRRDRPLGFAANCNLAFDETGEADLVLLSAEAQATPGWLDQLNRGAAAEPGAASLTPWCNDAEVASFPRPGERNPVPEFPERLAEAAASASWPAAPELPAVSDACCLYLRRQALRRIGGLDTETFAGALAIDDWCQRAAAMGWRNLLCAGAFLVRERALAEDGESSGDALARLLARWPHYQERVARFILSDSLRPWRERLQARIDELARSGPQRDLFN